MKYSLAAIILISSLGNTYAQKDFYTKRWSEVYRHELNALPRSALAVIDSLYTRAKRDNNVTQFTKALLYQSKFALALQENAEPEIVRKLEKEIDESKGPLKNILESILGNIYWQSFKGNRWKYYNRSTTSEKANPDDFRTWDSEAMFATIHKHFQNSITNATDLQNIPLDAISEILALAEGSQEYRPTLFDFLAHNALDFYTTGESGLAKPSNRFIINDEEYFSSFEKLPLQSNDSLSAHFQAMRIFRDLLLFHSRKGDTAAYVNLEIERLAFIRENGQFNDAIGLYKTSLSNLGTTYRRHPASTLVDFALASLLSKEGDDYTFKNTANQFRKKEALNLCDNAIMRFPKSKGAERCGILKEQILAKNLALKNEPYIPINKPSRLLVNYTNVDSLYFSVYKITADFEQQFTRSMNDSARSLAIQSLTPEKKWQTTVKNYTDYQSHATEVVVPPLSQGRFLLIATLTKSMEFTDNITAYTTIQVTDIALTEFVFNNTHRFQVVNRNNGKPVEGADVHIKTKPGNQNYKQVDEHLTSDQNGFVEYKRNGQYYSYVEATVTTTDDQSAFGDYYFYQHKNNNAENDNPLTAKSFLFTDRSIYRPGQTVFFKGILIKRKEKKATVVPGEYVEVFLEDVSGQEVGSLRLKTNAFGSFSGEFKLTSSALTGEYSLYADEDMVDASKFYDNLDNFEHDETIISVEAYKRPTFETSFMPVKETFKLNDTITVSGSAAAFSTSKISKAKVIYTVKRKVRFPRWYSWQYGNDYPEEEEITHGETLTDDKGEFTINFKAIPDESIPPANEPVFNYSVSADVTDINGETRSATTEIKIGYHSMVATITTASQIDLKIPENTISIATENLNGQFLPAKGKIEIYKLQGPPSPTRKRPWEAPDSPIITEKEFRELFPNDPYEDDAINPLKWKKGKLISTVEFDTEKSKEVQYRSERSWESGYYIMELTTADATGQPVKDSHLFTVANPANKKVADNALMIFQTDKPSYKAGEVARLKVGSASEDVTFIIEVEKDYAIAKTYIEHFSGNTKEILIPVTGTQDNGFSIHCSGVVYNSFLQRSKSIPVESDIKKFEIETQTFRDKLRPGAKEMWSFIIKGNESTKVQAEVLASMYDASLDQFKPHDWSFNPVQKPVHYSQYQVNGQQSFRPVNFIVKNLSYNHQVIPRQNFDQFDWFGFSLTRNSYTNRQYLQRLYFNNSSAGKESTVSISNTKNVRKGYVSGRVTSRDGSALPGVNVIIIGTTRGTVTDESGTYSLLAGKDDVLAYSFVGYVSAEARPGRKNTIDVMMEPDIMRLSEVVVVGYGVQTKKTLAGAVAAVTVSKGGYDEIVLEEALKGKASGVQLMSSDRAYNITIRGSSSMPTGDPPLYVIDGIIVEASTISETDLANVQVLKGAAATALYGARAANGVIIITTKSGQQKMDEALAKVNARKNFNETAFFFPHLSTDEGGNVKFSFTTPESLTRWKLQLLAHTKDLLTATKTLQAVTQKELMVTPNPPRFLRVGDEIIFSAKIANLSGNQLDGTIALQLTNAVTGESTDQHFANVVRNRSFKTSARGNAEVSWKLKIPEGVDAVQYKIVAKAGNFSDGEQKVLPVLSNRMLVTESMPFYVRSSQTKTFTLQKLQTQTSSTLQHHQLTLEITSNPAWYALQALPYLMEYPHECAEQLFARYYANALASHVVNSNQKIKEVFDKWSSSNQLISNLEKDPELKSIVLEETPWLRDAETETEQKKRIALLFDLNTMKDQLRATINKLQEMQFGNGGFPWFAGSRDPNRYITQHIASGYGHLKKLKVSDQTEAIIIKAVKYLDEEIKKDHDDLLSSADRLYRDATISQDRDKFRIEYLAKSHLNPGHIQYLYMRSFYDDLQPDEKTKEAIQFYRNQASKYWQDFNLYLKGMIALSQFRSGNKTSANEIIHSLKENAIVSDELGMYWKENVAGWYWHQAPVETQALLIEAFAEIEAEDKSLSEEDKRKTLDELRIWLLKNKQTTSWRTTKATTEAVYALLIHGTDWLSMENAVEVTVGHKKINTEVHEPEAGTGYFKTSWKAEAITNDMATVTFTKHNEGIAWGALYWQYFEDLDKITRAETPLKLTKKIYAVTNTDRGELLKPFDREILKTGDLIRIRIELTADRPMEFLHLKDMRAAGLEPVDVLSAYKWQEGLGYYQSTRDASTNFFFEYVPRGVYVFEYDLRVNNKGNFSNGISTIQSMYAPEFTSHSEGVRLVVE